MLSRKGSSSIGGEATIKYLYVLGTVLLTTYGQVILKWRLSLAGPFPRSLAGKVLFLLSQFRNLWILSGFAAAGLAALCWMAALTQFQLSYAYPFMSLSFVLVLVLSVAFLGEGISVARTVGIVMILVGILVGSRG